LDARLSAFREDLEAAIPALRRYAQALARDAEIGDDLVQDTLVRALQSEQQFHGGEIRGWLYTILTNLNRDRLRLLARRNVRVAIDTPRVAAPNASTQDIERALANLTADQRAVVLLVVLEGLSYHEVAEVQAVPIGTIMSRLARARSQMRSFLDGERLPSTASKREASQTSSCGSLRVATSQTDSRKTRHRKT
jgi:RNA polymerase sigma-70 factor, ECF subfamily